MNTSDDHTTPGKPGKEEPLTDLFRDVLDRIDETVAGITDAEVDQRMHRLLILAAAGTPPAAALAPADAEDSAPWAGQWPEAITVLRVARSQAAHIIAAAWQRAEYWAAEADDAAQAADAARQDADRILAGARRHVDAALDRAAEIISEASQEADRVISNARREADRVVSDAQENADQITLAARSQTQPMPEQHRTAKIMLAAQLWTPEGETVFPRKTVLVYFGRHPTCWPRH